jgi:4-hydroxy-tetrahydrodipicolinate reductase
MSGTATARKKYRVVQWATGNVGTQSLRRVIEHPDLELVGVHVHNQAKVGRDAGDLCGLPPTGIRATSGIEDILRLKPDCVLHMPHVTNLDEVCRVLAGGSNVITTRTEFQNPAALDPAVRAQVEDACRCGLTSLHGTGSSPGFITEALPIVLTSIQRELHHLRIDEFADNTTRNTPELLFNSMGFGKTNAQPNPARLSHLRDSFMPSLGLVAEAMGCPFDDVEVSGGIGLARHDVRIAAGLVPAGTVAAQRTTLKGMRGGKAFMTFNATWYVSTDVDTSDGEDWHFRSSGWRIQVDGDCPLDIGIRFPIEDPVQYARMTPGLTAHRPVNAIPCVCEAPPGIRTTVDLPQVIGRFG